MSKPVRSSIFVLVLLILVAANSAAARGILGERYFGISASGVFPGEEEAKRIDDFAHSLGIGCNIPVTSHLDASLSFGYSLFGSRGTRARVETYMYNAGFDLHSSTERTVAFFFGSEFVVHDTRYSRTKETDPGLSVAAGIEIDLHEKVAISPYVGYFTLFDGSAESRDGESGFTLNAWLHRSIFVVLGSGIAFEGNEKTDIGVITGLGVTF